MNETSQKCPLSNYPCDLIECEDGSLSVSFDTYFNSPTEFVQSGYKITAKLRKTYLSEPDLFDMKKVWFYVAEWLYYHQNAQCNEDILILCVDEEKGSESNYISIEDILSLKRLPEDIPQKILKYIYANNKPYELFPAKIFYEDESDATLDILSLSSFDELDMLLKQLEANGFLFISEGDIKENDKMYVRPLYVRSLMARLTPLGVSYLRGAIGQSNHGFVAMKFGKSPEWVEKLDDKSEKIHPKGERDLDKFYNKTIKKAIEKAGFNSVRIDEVSHNKKIDDEILVQIRKSKFVVCDLTYANLGAYYEAGFAQGLGKEVFFICEKNYFESNSPHFDINHHITTLYEVGQEDKFIRKLSSRIANNVSIV